MTDNIATPASELALALRLLSPGALRGVIHSAWGHAERARLADDPSTEALGEVWRAFALLAAQARDEVVALGRELDAEMRTSRTIERPGVTDDEWN